MGTAASSVFTKLLGGGVESEKDEADASKWYVGWFPSRVWVASPLTQHFEVVCEAHRWGENHIQFNASCPCCKRPLELTIEHKALCDGASLSEPGSRCAFAVCFWCWLCTWGIGSCSGPVAPFSL